MLPVVPYRCGEQRLVANSLLPPPGPGYRLVQKTGNGCSYLAWEPCSCGKCCTGCPMCHKSGCPQSCSSIPKARNGRCCYRDDYDSYHGSGPYSNRPCHCKSSNLHDTHCEPDYHYSYPGHSGHSYPGHSYPCHSYPCHSYPCHSYPCHSYPCHSYPCRCNDCSRRDMHNVPEGHNHNPCQCSRCGGDTAINSANVDSIDLESASSHKGTYSKPELNKQYYRAEEEGNCHEAKIADLSIEMYRGLCKQCHQYMCSKLERLFEEQEELSDRREQPRQDNEKKFMNNKKRDFVPSKKTNYVESKHLPKENSKKYAPKASYSMSKNVNDGRPKRRTYVR